MAGSSRATDSRKPSLTLPEGDGGFAVLYLVLALVLAPSAMATWLALASGQAGRFSPPLAWSGAGAAFVGVLLAAWTARRRFTWSAADGVTLLVVALALVRVWPATTPWPAFLDASWYVNAGARIAADGALRFDLPSLPRDPEARRAVVATLGDHRTAGVVAMPPDDTRGTFDVAFAVSDVERGSITPYHPPYFTSSVALAARLLDPWRGGWAVLPWAAAWLLAVAALARVAFGAPAATIAVVVAALSPAFAYYGRSPFAEMCAGALAIAALAAIVALVQGQGGGARLAMAGLEPRDGRARLAMAGLAGMLLGLSVLAKAEMLLLLLVVGLWWLVSRRDAGGRAEAVVFVAGIALPLVHFAVLARDVSRVYVGLNGGGVLALARGMTPWLGLGALLLSVVAIAALARRHRGNATTALEWRRLVALAAVLGLAGSTVWTQLAPVDAPPSMTSVLSWLVTPLALWAALVGVVLALETGHRRSGPILAVALVALPIVLIQPAVTESLSSLYSARRLVAFGVPVVAVLAAGTAAVPLTSFRRRRPLAVAALAGVALAAANLYVTSAPLARLQEFGGGVTVSRKLAAMGDERSVYLFGTVLDGSYAGRLAAALWNLEGRATAVIAAPDTDPAAIAAAVDGWRADGRRVLLVVDDLDRAPHVPGYEERYVDETTVIPQVLSPNPGLPPRVKNPPLELRFTVLELVPDGQAESG